MPARAGGKEPRVILAAEAEYQPMQELASGRPDYPRVESRPRERDALTDRETDERSVSLLAFCAIAVLVGGITGLGAIAFRALIALVHNLFFLGHVSAIYNANTHTPPSPWALVILVPVLGGMAVVFLVRKFAPEARGHGVPEVMDAIFYKEGRIRPVVAAVKSLASALAIGSGSAVGREGPIIQIGASLWDRASASGSGWRHGNALHWSPPALAPGLPRL